MCFDTKTLDTSEFYYLESGLYPSITDNVEAMNSLIGKNTITAKTVLQLKGLEEWKKLRYTLQMKDLVFHFLVWIWDQLSVPMMAMNLEWCWEEKGLDFHKKRRLFKIGRSLRDGKLTIFLQ